MYINQDSLRIMTFNIRYENELDLPLNSWDYRKKMVTDLLTFHRPDLFGLQEVLKDQLHYINSALPDYDYFGVGREDGIDTGEFSPIFYAKDKFKLRQKGYFWLSPTPDTANSIGWDAALTRIVTWVELERLDKSSRLFLFNGHFDHFGKIAAEESARLVLTKINEIAGSSPVFFMGDLNNTPDSEMYQILTQGGLTDCILPTHYGPKDSFIGFEPIKMYYQSLYGGLDCVSPENEIGRIDYIFCKNKVSVVQYGILSDNIDGLFPSDHMPAVTDILI